MANFNEFFIRTGRNPLVPGTQAKPAIVVKEDPNKPQNKRHTARLKGELIYAHGESRAEAIDKLLRALKSLGRPSSPFDYEITDA